VILKSFNAKLLEILPFKGTFPNPVKLFQWVRIPQQSLLLWNSSPLLGVNANPDVRELRPNTTLRQIRLVTGGRNTPPQ
jgi:hypothetical protein